MKTFKIEVQEILSRIVEINANSKVEAIEKVELLYKHEEVVLDHFDHISTNIVINMNDGFVNNERYDLINEVLDYIYENEKKHYEEHDFKPKDHIYLKLKRLKELNF